MLLCIVSYHGNHRFHNYSYLFQACDEACWTSLDPCVKLYCCLCWLHFSLWFNTGWQFPGNKIVKGLNIYNDSLQNKTKISELHYFGAILAFGVGSFYCCVVTVISWHMAVIGGKKMLLIIVRVFMCCCLIGGIITCKFANMVTIATVHVHNKNYDK